jgi:ABC-2 type transport system permease protein
MSRLTTDIKYSLLMFFRNRQSMFIAFLFPIVFLVLAWSLFGSQAGAPTLYYFDGDGSQASASFVGAMGSAGTIELQDGSGMDLAKMLKDGQVTAYLEIPPGFGENIADNASGAGLKLYYDRSRPAANTIISAVQHAVNELNMGIAGAGEAVTLSPEGVATAGTNYVDFLLPGILGIAIMGSAVDLTVGFVARLRAAGIFRKLAMTPMTRVEWNISRVVTGTMIVALSIMLSLAVAWLAFGARPAINVVAILLMLAGSVMFIGLGMVIAYLIKGEGAANAAFTVTLPLIFISGSIFPVDRLPSFLQALAIISPLTYLNDGLRSAMVTGNMANAWTDLAVVSAMAVVLFGIGVVVLKWRDD